MGRILFCIGLMVASSIGYSHEQVTTYNRINLSVSAQQEVDNDTLVAVLFAQEEGQNATRLANTVNRNISSAVSKAKLVKGIKVQTLDYTTNPTYRQQSVSGWRVRQSIRLESKEAAVLSELIGSLQKDLGVSSIRYTLSPQSRRDIEDELISEAIARFNSRAQLISKEMGRQTHKLVQMDINGSGRSPQPQARMARMDRSMGASAPTLEAGTQVVTVNIHGTIELQ